MERSTGWPPNVQGVRGHRGNQGALPPKGTSAQVGKAPPRWGRAIDNAKRFRGAEGRDDAREAFQRFKE